MVRYILFIPIIGLILLILDYVKNYELLPLEAYDFTHTIFGFLILQIVQVLSIGFILTFLIPHWIW